MIFEIVAPYVRVYFNSKNADPGRRWSLDFASWYEQDKTCEILVKKVVIGVCSPIYTHYEESASPCAWIELRQVIIKFEDDIAFIRPLFEGTK